MKRTLLPTALTTAAAVVTVAVAGILAAERSLQNLDVAGIQAMLTVTQRSERLVKTVNDHLPVHRKHAPAPSSPMEAYR